MCEYSIFADSRQSGKSHRRVKGIEHAVFVNYDERVSDDMTPRLIAAHYVRDYVLHVRFADGSAGAVDLEGELHGEIFEPLRASAYFRQFQVRADIGTITWPNGADFAPEFLYDLVRIPA